MIFWLLAREVKILRGELGKSEDWDVMVDLFFYKELDKVAETEDDNEKGDEEGGKPAPTKEKGAWDHQGEDVEEGGDWE
jgi:small subunit ribosomal protein SAe